MVSRNWPRGIVEARADESAEGPSRKRAREFIPAGWLAGWAVALVLAGPAAAADGQRYITDERGRALILHGLNVSGSAKWDPERMPGWSERTSGAWRATGGSTSPAS
jgi:hypothetical protein